MPRNLGFACVVIVAALATIACDNPADVGRGTVPKAAGSFEVANVCGAVLESASGGITTISRYPIQVDSRSADGTIVWSKSLQTGNLTCTGAIAPSGNLVISTGDSVFSLKAETGAVRWRFTSGSAQAVWIAISASGKIFLIARNDNAPGGPETLYALSDADGSVLWSRILDRGGIPYVDDARSTLYYLTAGRTVAMNVASGTVKWDISTDGAGYAAIAADGSLLIENFHQAGTVNDPSSYEIDGLATNGSLTWKSGRLGTGQNLTGPPIIDDAGTVYSATSAFEGFGLSGASVYALSVGTGDIRWKRDFYRIKSTLAVDADRTLYVIAQAAADSVDQIYGLRNGVTVSAATPVPRGLYAITPLTIHPNKLLYYVGSSKVGYIPTAGVSANAAWPMDRHDAKRTASR